MRNRSLLGFLVSLLFHGTLVAAIAFALRQNESANSQSAQLVDTNISMEMMMATVIEEAPEPLPEVEPEPEPEPKEEIPDPTLKQPEPKVQEKPKPEKKSEPKQKPKPPKQRPKPKPKDMPKDAVKADRINVSEAKVNSAATTTAATTTNPNLSGKGSSSSEKDAYSHALRREIERHKRYSQRARMMRKQGTVTIGFNLADDGSISGARILRSSGSEDLDNAALSAVQSAKSVGPRPAGIPSSLNVPIRFSLQ
ncbi:outer membrane transport energization protein TonB [Mesocricetibacter intestinalis]|uniref:Protein TonB n=1 Tax=Mesocricetibacter intestinalis TaxID=1521930 RepID=A0A4R6VLB7_9PAST|nr:energy transducer TonB [Mesocricetibacter intestinalis]TDQ59600.1 outer membrane transport energization protein TonB [Mesocricetibacter intestinalis]